MATPADSKFPFQVACKFTNEQASKLRRYAEDEDVSVRAAVRRFVKAGLAIAPKPKCPPPPPTGVDYPVQIICSFTQEQGDGLRRYAEECGLTLRYAIRRFVTVGLTIHNGLPEVATHPEQQTIPLPSQETTPDD